LLCRQNPVPEAEAMSKRKIDYKNSSKSELEKEPLLHAKALSVDKCLNSLNGWTKISDSFS
jgi:hypothetical protein